MTSKDSPKPLLPYPSTSFGSYLINPLNWFRPHISEFKNRKTSWQPGHDHGVGKVCIGFKKLFAIASWILLLAPAVSNGSEDWCFIKFGSNVDGLFVGVSEACNGDGKCGPLTSTFSLTLEDTLVGYQVPPSAKFLPLYIYAHVVAASLFPVSIWLGAYFHSPYWETSLASGLPRAYFGNRIPAEAFPALLSFVAAAIFAAADQIVVGAMEDAHLNLANGPMFALAPIACWLILQLYISRKYYKTRLAVAAFDEDPEKGMRNAT